jgi:hypothetical protein
MRARSLALLLVALVSVEGAFARGDKPAPTAPGTYKEWGPDIDSMEIVKTFKLSDYSSVVVLPFNTSATPLPDKTDKSYDTIKSVLDGYTLSLFEAIKPELKAKVEISQADKAPKPTKTMKTLILRGTVVDLSPGSRAKRYLGGFGAGAAGTKITGELVDAKSGAVLAKFSQERRSGGTWKFGGGKDMDVMRDSIHAVGQDVAHLLDAF